MTADSVFPEQFSRHCFPSMEEIQNVLCRRDDRKSPVSRLSTIEDMDEVRCSHQTVDFLVCGVALVRRLDELGSQAWRILSLSSPSPDISELISIYLTCCYLNV
jgi:hypothetical protein